jgi:hypothetical protein
VHSFRFIVLICARAGCNVPGTRSLPVQEPALANRTDAVFCHIPQLEISWIQRGEAEAAIATAGARTHPAVKGDLGGGMDADATAN